ncbi:hypothetical protein LBMAG56_25520 [Verrucomicrobiota bacterium]|nr:hypothetical protein LBMAG56_25520 [Verrucomicrobiota bacterium]
MKNLLHLFCLAVGVALLTTDLRAAEPPPLPPFIASAATTRLDAGGRPWAYVTLGESRPGLVTAHPLAVYVKSGLPAGPGTFAFRGLVLRTTDPTAIAVLLNRAASLGDNLADLDSALVTLHTLLITNANSSTVGLPTPPVLPLNQRLAALLSRAEGDTSLLGLLDMLGVGHPAMQLVRGLAWAGPLDVPVGTDVTIELRERNASGADIAVVGRLSLRAGQPTQLPAPGPLAVVPDLTAAGELNVKLRWASAPELRRLPYSGVVIWRTTRAFAEARSWHLTPPTATVLAAFALSNPADVKRVGPGTFTASKLFDALSVTNFHPVLGDPTTSFLTDDNDRKRPGGVAMPAGAQVLYFGAAVDALGTPGAVSAGVVATFCHRIPPPLPQRFAVANAYDTAGAAQFFQLSWRQNPVLAGSGDGASTTSYELFRGDDLTYHERANYGQFNLDADPIDPAKPDAIKRIAVVADPAQVPAAMLGHADRSVPAVDANFGRTWWFAIRAVHQGPPGCGNAVSVLSPPVFTALRQRVAPLAPNANQVVPQNLNCLRVACMVAAPASDEVSATPLDASVAHYRVRCTRRNGIASAQIRVTDLSTVPGVEIIPPTLVEFPEGAAFVEFDFARPLETINNKLAVECQGVAFDGTLSRWDVSRAKGVATANHFVLHQFLVGAIAESERLALRDDLLWATLTNDPQAGESPCAPERLLTVSPDSGLILPVSFRVTFTPRSEEFRLYRRVNDGPLSLVSQGLRVPVTNATVEVSDKTPPTTCCTLSYYVQLLDADANASPLALVLTKKIPGPKPPAPLLLQPLAADLSRDALNRPVVNLRWVCPPAGVERFEVFIWDSNSKAPSTAPEVSAPDKLTLVPGVKPQFFKVTSKSETTEVLTMQLNRRYVTGRVGGDFGAGPQFALPVNVSANIEYRVFLRALGACGEIGELSSAITFKWQPPAPAPAGIAWPRRPLPNVGAFHPDITVVDFRSLSPNRLLWDAITPSVKVDETPVGIRVGALTLGAGLGYRFTYTNGPVGEPVPAFLTPPGTPALAKRDPNSQLYPNPSVPEQTLLPCVLYRRQVTNAAFPNVSGDVVQCSPLIRTIAWRDYLIPSSDPRVILPPSHQAVLADPFFRWVGLDFNAPPLNLELYLVDTQPVVTGARYRYWLVRFDATTGEPIHTVPAGEITIQAAP